MNALKSLYNGIMNDYSVRRYTLGWNDITSKLEKRYKNITRTDEEFTDKLVTDALQVAKGKLHESIINFSRELNINIKTLSDKQV